MQNVFFNPAPIPSTTSGESTGRSIGDEEFAAPGVLVAAEPEPVEGDADHRTRNTVVSEAGGDMRVVMLHLHQDVAVASGPLDAELG